MSGNIKRAALLAASGGAYVSAVYISYLYFTADKKQTNTINNTINNNNNSSTNEKGCTTCTPTFSYVSDPCRTNTFQKIAYAYDDEISKDELVMGINLLRRFLLYFHAKGDVLEVGAGTGRNIDYYPTSSSWIAKHTINKIVLTDTSDKMLLRAKEKLASQNQTSVQTQEQQQNKRFEVKVADAANLHMYNDNSFDTIVDTFGLCSFDDPVVVLKELQRVCKPDGIILLLEHGRSKKYEKLSKYLDKNAERHAKNWGCVWNRDIDGILEQAGLSVESLYTWHFGTTYYVVCRPGDVDVGKKKKEEVVEEEGRVQATSTMTTTNSSFLWDVGSLLSLDWKRSIATYGSQQKKDT